MKAFLRKKLAPATGAGKAGSRMILVEHGVPASGLLLASTEGGADLVVHVQQHGEPAMKLVHAALKSIGVLERDHSALARAAIVVGTDRSAESRAARELTARAVMTHMLVTGGGELELVGPSGGHLGAREDLMLLVEELLTQAAGGTVSIRIRFAEDCEPQALPARRAA